MRKKLFAIVMSMTMVASFMPSLAFAAVTDNHAYAVEPSSVSWTAVKTALSGANADFVEVVKAPTHSVDGLVDGVVKLTCIGDFCGEAIERVIPAEHEFVNTAMTPEAFANAKKAQGDWDNADVNQFLVTWMAADKYCSITAEKCSCGYVGERVTGTGTSVEHQAPSDLANCASSYVCTKCGATVNRTVASPAHEHAVTDLGTVVSKKDCGHGDVLEFTCTKCGEKYLYEDPANPATGNCVPKKTIAPTATKTTDKVNGYVEYYVGTTKIAYNDSTGWHETPGYQVDTTYDSPVFYVWDTVVEEGSCEEGKTVGFTCATCGAVEEVDLAPTGHDWETKKVAATCETGEQAYEVCKTCGEYKKADGTSTDVFKKAKFTATGVTADHSYVVKAVSATCTTPAHYEFTCSKCGDKGAYTFVNDVNKSSKWFNPANRSVVPNHTKDNSVELAYLDPTVTPHKYTKRVTLKEATCENAELVGYKCDNCGKINAHATGVFAIAEIGSALDHTFVNVVVAPTCEKDGYTVKKCSSCEKYEPAAAGALVEDIANAKHYDTTDKLSSNGKHTGEVWKVTKAATVFEEGVKTLVCPTCGVELGAKTPVAKKTVAKAAPSVKAGKKSLTVKATAANATGYRVYYKKAGAKSWKSYTKKTASLSKTFSKLSKGKYYVKVKAYAKNYAGDGEVVWGEVSSTKTVTVK